jgi:ribose 5-phosphate isomerase RpiB
VRAFRSTQFAGGRHQRRVDLIETSAKESAK